MASSTSTSTSSSSSTKPKWIYDVFLSFRGEDTRHTVTSNLYNALIQAGIHAFMDDRGLEMGDEISRSLLQAIEGSRIAIVVLSQNYASSKCCLGELVKIMDCQKTLGQLVLPIFYLTDPSDIRRQAGSYGEAMKTHERLFGRSSDLVLQWRGALKAVGGLAGYVVGRGSGESHLVHDILKRVYIELDGKLLFVADHPVGIESRIREVKIESRRRPQNASIIGIWGMGGSGKTTLAKAMYNEICIHFEGKSFLSNIREVSKQDNGLLSLQKQFISDIFEREGFIIPDIERGKVILRERFPHRMAFVVLDDVDSLSQLTVLCGNLEWFHPGSIIIITTRNVRLLNNVCWKADYIYRMRTMDKTESLELLSWHAFKQEAPFENFIELSRNLVDYCGGLPLALIVLGSYLFERTIEEWEDVLSKLEKIPNDEIQAKLKISFDGLNDLEKNIFLDICCFFINKDRNYVTQILNGCGFHAEIGIQILIERSLINVNMHNKLGMYDLLRDMGREIIRESPPKDPEDCSRLWHFEDALDVLTEHTGTKAIEGISLKLPRTHREYCLIDSEAFKAMNKLRLLQLDYVNLDGDYEYISKKLRWLCWHGFPLKYTPDNLYQKNLVAIDFKYSNLTLVWKEPQLLQCLKTLILSHSSYLTQTPDFTKLPSLEKLILKDCPSLILVHQSIGDLKNLLHVNLKDCKCLRDLPRSIYKLKSLKTLILSGCSMIDHLEDDFEQMESLITLIANNTAITQVPYSLARLEGLVHGYISLCGYEGRAQDIFPSLVWSWMSPTNIPQFDNLALLLSISSEVFSAVQNGSFHGLSLSKLRNMWEECEPQFRLDEKIGRLLDALYGTNFMELESTPNVSPFSYAEAAASSDSYNQVHITRTADSFNSLLIQMGVCNKADMLKEKILRGWNYGGRDDSNLPGDEYPDWFMYRGERCSVFLKVPQVTGCHLKAMVLNVVYSCGMDNSMMSQFLINILIINYTKATFHHYKGNSEIFHEDVEWQGIISSIQPDDAVKIILNIGPQFTVNKIAAYLVYDDSTCHKLLKYLLQKLILVCNKA